MTEPKWLSIAEAAAVWKVAPITVHRWIKQGRVRAYKLGPRKVRLRAVDVDALPTPLHRQPVEAPDMPIELRREQFRKSLNLQPLTEEQLALAREANRMADELQARTAARLGDRKLPSSWRLIRKDRDERSFLPKLDPLPNKQPRKR